MNRYWDEEVPFISMFDMHHLFYISLMLLLLILMITQYDKVREQREILRKVILIVSIGQQVLLYAWYIFETGFDLSESLPFHISHFSYIQFARYLLFTDQE